MTFPESSIARRPSPSLLLGGALCLCLATRVYFLVVLPLCAEDAYITFRYAHHWAEGLGPVYNAGERAWGFTSALWTGLLALAAFARLPLEATARAVLVACDLASLALGFRLLARHSLLAAAGFGAFFALWPRLAQMPASGLESSLVLALVLAAATFAATRIGGLLNGLLALSRPEGAAMSALLAFRLSARQRLVWLLPGVPPQTHDGEALAPVAILLLTGLVAALARWRRDAGPDAPLPLLLACGLLTLCGYMALGVPWFSWYAPVPMTLILLAVFLGLARSGVLRWAFAPLALFLVVSWWTVAPRVIVQQTHDAAVFAGIGRTLREDAAGRAASVLLEPIGIIGSVSGLRVLDEVGLVTPWVAEERRKDDGWYARVLARDPADYVVIRKDWLEGAVAWAGAGAPFASVAQRESTMAGYVVVRHRAGGELPAGAGRLIILRRERPAGTGP